MKVSEQSGLHQSCVQILFFGWGNSCNTVSRKGLLQLHPCDCTLAGYTRRPGDLLGDPTPPPIFEAEEVRIESAFASMIESRLTAWLRWALQRGHRGAA